MVTFGSALQAFRLGYRISDKRSAFVKLADVDCNTLNITLVPLHKRVPDTRGRKGQKHYCWWETEHKGEDVLDQIPSIRNVRKVKQILSFDIDRETGERITK